jgi:hypothetical protein
VEAALLVKYYIISLYGEALPGALLVTIRL